MLAKRVDELPAGDAWIFEPKWDGFRALIFRDGDEILIQSRDEKPLNRYFPELVEPLMAQLPPRCVLDGEIVIAKRRRARLRCAATAASSGRVAGQASVETDPGIDRVLRSAVRRRSRLCEPSRSSAAGSCSKACSRPRTPPIHLTPATRDRAVAADWFRRFEGAGLDGVMAKPVAGTYEPNKRVMLKVKHERDCDCVVAGFRWHKKGEGTRVGSLLLGLYDDAGTLQHVGVCASFTEEKRRELVDFLAPYRKNALANHPWKHWAAVEEHGRGIACRAARAAGARARTFRGSRCAPSWW